MEFLLKLAEICAPILIALIGIIPTVKNTSKETKKAIDNVEKKLDEHIKDESENMAKQCRVRILQFWDECCEGRQFSENHYEDILEDIDCYEAFCASHPDFHNNKGKMAMQGIKDLYQKKKLTNAFLQPEK